MSISAKNIVIGHSTPLSVPIDLELPASGLVVLIGRNGVGKSTLLRTLAGLLPPLSGEVYYGESPIAALSHRQRARSVALVSTERQAMGSMTVGEYVMLGRTPYLGWSASPSSKDRNRVEEVLSQLAMRAFATRRFDTLSDGERQRVLIARALVQDTSTILLDEPTSHLDIGGRVEIIQLLSKIASDRSVMYSTHDISVAAQLTDDMVLLTGEECLRNSPKNLLKEKKLDSLFDQTNVNIEQPDYRIVIR